MKYIVSHVDVVDKEIRKVVEQIFSIALPHSSNPCYSYNNLCSVDKEYVDDIMRVLESPFEKRRSMIENQKKFALHKAMNLQKRAQILPIVHKSYKLLTSLFKRKQDKSMIPKFTLERPELPLYMDPKIVFDNFALDKPDEKTKKKMIVLQDLSSF